MTGRRVWKLVREHGKARTMVLPAEVALTIRDDGLLEVVIPKDCRLETIEHIGALIGRHHNPGKLRRVDLVAHLYETEDANDERPEDDEDARD